MYLFFLTERFLQELQSSLNDSSDDHHEAPPPKAPLLASLNWSTRKTLFSESWRAKRPHLVNTMAAQESVSEHILYANNVGAIQLCFVVVTVYHAPFFVINVMSSCTPDMSFTIDVP